MLGCQVRPPESPGGVFVAQAGSTGAVAVQVASARRIQASAGAVEKITLSLTGVTVPGTPSVDVLRSRFSNGKAKVEFGSILPGTIRVTADLYSSEAIRLGHAEATASVEAGKTAQLQLAVTPEFASASLEVDAADLPVPTASLSVGFEPIAYQTWQPAPPLAVPRAAFSAVPIGDKIWAVGGGDANDQLERYDPATGRWTPYTIPNNNGVRRPIGAAAALRGKIVFVGLDIELGQNESGVPFFLDPGGLDAFQSLQPFPYGDLAASLGDVKHYRDAVGVAARDDYLYVVGGSGKRGKGTSYVYLDFPTVEVLSARTGFWTERAPLNTSRGAPAAAFLAAELFVAGGFRWKGTPAVEPQLSKLTGVTHLDAILEATDSAEVYDPAADKWTAIAPLVGERYGAAMVAAGGRVYVLGGAKSDGQPVAWVDSFDPGAGTWREEPDMLEARAFPAAALLPGDKIMVLGGFGADKRPLRSAEVFNTVAQP